MMMPPPMPSSPERVPATRPVAMKPRTSHKVRLLYAATVGSLLLPMNSRTAVTTSTTRNTYIKMRVFIFLSSQVPMRTPVNEPMNTRAAAAKFPCPSMTYRVTPAKDRNTPVKSALPWASFCCSLSRNTNAGTSSTPPPMPNSPDMKPTQHPMRAACKSDLLMVLSKGLPRRAVRVIGI